MGWWLIPKGNTLAFGINGLLTTLPQDYVQAHSDLQIKDFQEKDKLFEWMEKI